MLNRRRLKRLEPLPEEYVHLSDVCEDKNEHGSLPSVKDLSGVSDSLGALRVGREGQGGQGCGVRKGVEGEGEGGRGGRGGGRGRGG